MKTLIITEKVKQHRCIHPRMGARKTLKVLSPGLEKIGIQIGRDKFFDLLRANRLLVKRRRNYAVTTQSYHHFKVYRNLIKGWQPSKPGQLWVSDITYMRTAKGFVYLFLITDAFSRKVVGWHLSDSLAIEGALKALQMALRQCKSTRGLIHHSDRGIQYCCKAYVEQLNQHDISISMAAAGDCYENALAERVNGILKDEYCLDSIFQSYNNAHRATVSAIKLYNEYRPHWSLGLNIPSRVHEKPESYPLVNVETKRKKNQKRKT